MWHVIIWQYNHTIKNTPRRKDMSSFESIIKSYLAGRCKDDAVFAEKYQARCAAEGEDKVVAGCCSYITAEAKKQAVKGCSVIEDAEVFGWAMHYIDEDIKAPKDAPKAEVKAKPIAETPKMPDSAPVARLKPKKVDECQLSLF
jgi:hypothetical protein